MPSATGKGDLAGQKARWRQRQRARRDSDEQFAEKWREQRRYEKACARARKAGRTPPAKPGAVRPQHVFDEHPNPCRSCGGSIPNGALYCQTVKCNPHLRAKRKRYRRKG